MHNGEGKKRKPLRRRKIFKKGLLVLTIVPLAYFPRTRAVFAMAYNSSPEPSKYVSTQTKEEAFKKLLKFYMGFGSLMIVGTGASYMPSAYPLIMMTIKNIPKEKVGFLERPKILLDPSQRGGIVGGKFNLIEEGLLYSALNILTSFLQCLYADKGCASLPNDANLPDLYCWKRNLTDSSQFYEIINEPDKRVANLLAWLLSLITSDSSLYLPKLNNSKY